MRTGKIDRTRTIGIAGAIVFMCSILLLENKDLLKRSFKDEIASPEFAVDTLSLPKPEVKFGMVVNDLDVYPGVVKRNQRFVDLLQGGYISNKVMSQLTLLPKNIFDFRRIASNKKYTLITRPDTLRQVEALVYEVNAVDYFIFHMNDSLWVEACQHEVIKTEKSVSGVILYSLYETIQSFGLSPDLTNKFVDIFAWQVDFQRLQKGDRFKIVYQEEQVDDQPIGIGKIEAVYFEHASHPYYAFPFDQGEGPDYFDEEGNSLHKALLKYPIEFTRISSRYSNSRFHPVAKVFRAHRGTDFAAPTGTPIRSVGDGIVEEATYTSGNGNYVKIRHNGTYTTQYLHMSGFASGIKAGVRVGQGQTIGYVGSTGLATGPHLCYRFWQNGVQVDALKVELPPSQPIKEELLSDFGYLKNQLIIKLNQITFPEEDLILARN